LISLNLVGSKCARLSLDTDRNCVFSSSADNETGCCGSNFAVLAGAGSSLPSLRLYGGLCSAHLLLYSIYGNFFCMLKTLSKLQNSVHIPKRVTQRRRICQFRRIHCKRLLVPAFLQVRLYRPPCTVCFPGLSLLPSDTNAVHTFSLACVSVRFHETIPFRDITMQIVYSIQLSVC